MNTNNILFHKKCSCFYRLKLYIKYRKKINALVKIKSHCVFIAIPKYLFKGTVTDVSSSKPRPAYAYHNIKVHCLYDNIF